MVDGAVAILEVREQQFYDARACNSRRPLVTPEVAVQRDEAERVLLRPLDGNLRFPDAAGHGIFGGERESDVVAEFPREGVVFQLVARKLELAGRILVEVDIPG